ncbi:MAG: HNH endonuclease signature motif containing protein [Actinomycetota bacterium]
MRPIRDEVFARDGYRCRIQAPGCTGQADDPHHLRKQSQGGADEPWNLVTSCRSCNEWVEQEPAEARRLGWNWDAATYRTHLELHRLSDSH